MAQYCCVRSCKEKKRAGSKLGFFRFPKAETMRKKWLAAVNKTEIDLITNKDLRVCSNHFSASDYVFGALRSKLKCVAVPVVRDLNEDDGIIPYTSDDIQQDHDETLLLRQIIKDQATKLEQQQLQFSLLQGEVKCLKNNNRFSIQKFMHDHNKIFHYTGFETYTVMIAVYEEVLPSMNKNILKKLSLSSKNQFFLTMVWLRRGLDYETLGDMFRISKDMTEKICLCWIDAMSICLGSSNLWPHRNVLIQNSPREQCKNFIGCIDCIEFQIEKPEHSNGSKTLKSLIMTDHNGDILYKSRLFTGSISDEDIIVQSGFLETLKSKLHSNKSGDIILADQGFNVSSLKIESDINIPTSRADDLRFTEEEIQRIRQVSLERIHLERAISRLKQYRILATEVPVGLLGTIEQIYTVCCLLINLKGEAS